MDKKQQYYAHTPVAGSEEWHDLTTHLLQTSDLARLHAAKFGAGELGRLAGLWHDVGKFNPDFQDYLRDCYDAALSGAKAPRGGSVPHAVYGAMLAANSVQMLAPVIYGHHAGLPNFARLRDALGRSSNKETFDTLLPAARGSIEGLDFRGVVRDVISNPPADEFQMDVLGRMLFSSLVDADFLDTETHFNQDLSEKRGSQITPSEMWEVLRRDQERLMRGSEENTGTVDRVRREVYEDCVSAAKAPTGVFRLAVPTGGGKTRSGLAFALRHATLHELDRVVVAVPYTSIIEQTASVYQGIFSELGDEAVLEHHSAVRREDERDLQDAPKEAERLEESRARARLASENWDAPLVVTTTVQLFESLFSNRTSRCRKLHNIANSVIVLDEVQTLPVGLLAPTVSLLSELVRRYGVTVVLCTATQPALEGQSRYLEGFEEVRDIVPPERVTEHFYILRRVEYEVPGEEWSWREAAERLVETAPEGQAMAILNTRKDALALLDELGGLGTEALHLSTLLCGAHRRDVLEEVRRRLSKGEPCLLVATQVVEAGVDLDFPLVFRAMGPLDRIVQAAGRCNREGRRESGRVVVFRPEEGRVPRGEYAAGFAEAEILLSRSGFDLHEPEVFREYFRLLYQDVPTDREEIQKYRKGFDYPEVASRYRLISEQSVPVIVRYEPNAEEVDDLIVQIERFGLSGAMHRSLQPYVISMFERDFERQRAFMLELAEGTYLWTGAYGERGIEEVGDDPADLII